MNKIEEKNETFTDMQKSSLLTHLMMFNYIWCYLYSLLIGYHQPCKHLLQKVHVYDNMTSVIVDAIFIDHPHKLYCKMSKLLSIYVAFVVEFLWIIDQNGSFYCTTQAPGHEFLSPTASATHITSWIDNYGQGSICPFNASLLALFMTLQG